MGQATKFKRTLTFVLNHPGQPRRFKKTCYTPLRSKSKRVWITLQAYPEHIDLSVSYLGQDVYREQLDRQKISDTPPEKHWQEIYARIVSTLFPY